MLHSTATASVCTVLGEMATALFPGGVETVFPRKSYLCKQCVRAVERIIKLRETIYKEEEVLKEKIACVGEAKGLSRGEYSDRTVEEAGEFYTCI